VTTRGACEQSPHYHRASDTVNASGNSIPLMTKCIQGTIAAMALLAGVIPPNEINKEALVSGVSKLDVFYSRNTIYAMLPSEMANGIIEVYNFNGRLVHKKDIAGNNKKSVMINSSGFANGVYHIRLISRNGQASNKIVVTQ
jgi:hypothetical protein